MIEIRHKNAGFSYFEVENYELKKKIALLLSPYADGYSYSPAYKIGSWDGRIPFYRVSGNMMLVPRGLLFYIEELFKENNIEYTIENEDYENISREQVDEFIKSLKIPFEPYEYQKKCVYDSLVKGRLTNISATGSGKSLIIYILMRYMIESDRSVMIIVPNIMLVNQIYNDFIDYGFSNIDDYVQRIGGEHKVKEITKHCVITTWQSQYRNDTEFYDRNAIIIDECHGVGVDSQIKEVILPKATKAKYRWGFTGTIPKSEISRLSIFSALGEPNRVINAQGLIEAGLATPVKIKSILIHFNKDEAEVVNRQKNYNYEEQFIISHKKRNEVLIALIEKISKKGNTLVLYSKIAHGDFLLQLLIKKKTNLSLESFEVIKELKSVSKLSKDLKYFIKTPLTDKNKKDLLKNDFNLDNFIELDTLNVFCVDGSISSTERERIRQILEHKEAAIILATLKTFSTGINVKKLHSLVLASSTKSEITIGQSIGRIMRLHSSKEVVTVYDIVDCLIGKRGKENYFFRHFKERLSEYIDAGYPTEEINLSI